MYTVELMNPPIDPEAGTMITSEELAERMKADILADIASGTVPRSVKTFAELHDYVDANCYGGTEALLDELDAAAPDTDEGHSGALGQLCDVMNPAIEIIDRWLAAGGARRPPAERSR